MKVDGSVFKGLYVVGEVVGFGGGGVYGYNSLEGIFLGGCIFFGRMVGLGIVEELGYDIRKVSNVWVCFWRICYVV